VSPPLGVFWAFLRGVKKHSQNGFANQSWRMRVAKQIDKNLMFCFMAFWGVYRQGEFNCFMAFWGVSRQGEFEGTIKNNSHSHLALSLITDY
jgi:hypothetical protein